MNTLMLKTNEQIELMKCAGHLVGATHRILQDGLKAGQKTSTLDKLAEDFIRSQGAVPAFKGYRGFPYTICCSVNEEVVHGFPSEKELQEGDLVSIDVGVVHEGFNGDAAFSAVIEGDSTERQLNLMDTTRRALTEGIQKARDGYRVSDISNAVQTFVEGSGFNVIREYGGHGIGKELHEQPFIPNYGPPNHGAKLKAGMVICIEPMVVEGHADIEHASNGWTVRTKDHKLAAHFEHMVLITKDMPRILSI